MKKKILIDLDVLTVAFWDSKKEAIEFLDRIKKGEFELYVPYSILELLDKWRHKPLAEEVRHFYNLYSARIMTASNILDGFKERGLEYEGVYSDLKKIGIKEEDIVLIVTASILQSDFLVTYNKTHLKNNKEVINEILRKHKMREIEIIGPGEI